MAINLSLNKLPWYTQVGVFVALSAAAVGAFWYFYADKTMADIAAREAQLATINQQIERGLNTAKRLPEFRREVESLEAQLDRLRAVLPEEQDVGDLLRRVQAMATQSRLTIRGFTPRSVTRRQMHAEWPIGLQLEGTYHDLGTFLERVSKFTESSTWAPSISRRRTCNPAQRRSPRTAPRRRSCCLMRNLQQRRRRPARR